MIQLTVKNTVPNGLNLFTGYFNVEPYFTVTPTIDSIEFLGVVYYVLKTPYFLWKLESQQTGKVKYFNYPALPIVGSSIQEIWLSRYVTLQFYNIVSPTSTEDLAEGKVRVGTTDFPLGLYNLNIYETMAEGEERLNPANATATLFSGILNMTASDSNEEIGDTDFTYNFQSLNYNQYSSNDADTESIYLTNTVV